MNSDSVIAKSKMTKVKGKGQSVMSTVTAFVLKRIKGTQTWQRMQIRKNTAANKDIVVDPSVMFAQYE
jgi:hypothetical protein